MRNPFYVPDSTVSTERKNSLGQSVPIGYIINEEDLRNGTSGIKVFKKNNDLSGVGEIVEQNEADETDLMADYLAQKQLDQANGGTMPHDSLLASEYEGIAEFAR